MRRHLCRRSSRWGWAVAVAASVLVAAAVGSAAGPADSPASGEWWLQAVDTADLTPPGPGTPVLIIDRGLDLSHPDFAARPDTAWLNQQTFWDETSDGFHATAMASIVGAPGRIGGLVGIYPRARIYSWDASPDGLLESVYVLSGMQVASRYCPAVILLSFGLSGNQFVHTVERLQEGIDAVVDRGCLVVAAAGNERYQGSPPFYPAGLPHVLAVAATAPSGSVAPFSNSSPAIDLAAPGVEIPIAVPPQTDPGGYSTGTGTSYAAAIVAGAAAWVWTMRPDLQASQVAEVLRRSARDLGTPGPDNDTGWGLLDLAAALRTPAPPPDPQEPNDDIWYDLPLGLPSSGAHPLTAPRRLETTLTASVTAIKDPIDVYRVWAPTRGTVTATLTPAAGLALRLWSDQTPTVYETGPGRRADLLARGSPAGALRYRSRSPRGHFLYLEVAAASNLRSADFYTLSVSARQPLAVRSPRPLGPRVR
jgi:subtilisin family serine protease